MGQKEWEGGKWGGGGGGGGQGGRTFQSETGKKETAMPGTLAITGVKDETEAATKGEQN